MNTEIRRHIFDAVEDSACLHGKQLPAQLAGGVYGREASVSAAEAMGAALHGQPGQPEKHEVVS